MISKFDFKEGLIKIYWHDIRDYINKIEPTFTKIVDEISPDKKYPLYLAFYPFGANDADTISSLFPSRKGSYYRINEESAPKDMVKNLGYSTNSTPLGMVLEKEIECFIDLPNEKITIPWLVYTPGKIFPFSRILNKHSDRVYAPNGLLSSTAGARSCFMLPSIGCSINHINLQRDFNIELPPPKTLYDHWFIFKNIINSEQINSNWRCCIMYFSEIWIQKIHSNKSWGKLKNYLHELAWYYYEYERNRIYYDIAFSMIQQRRNLKPNPYLVDTAKHLFEIALGTSPGFTPALTNNSLPLTELQNVFVNSYGLKKYLPTILQPTHYYFETDKMPVYYSLQRPSTRIFSPKSRDVSSTLYEIRELEYLMKIFIQELSKENSICADTIINQIARNIKFNYFHNNQDSHRSIRLSTDIPKEDKRFLSISGDNKLKNAVFAEDASFLRGCIRISNG